MTNETYKEAEKIQSKLKDLRNLRRLICKPYICFAKEHIFLCDCDRKEMCLCDEDLNEVVRDYCDKRIKELQVELETL